MVHYITRQTFTTVWFCSSTIQIQLAMVQLSTPQSVSISSRVIDVKDRRRGHHRMAAEVLLLSHPQIAVATSAVCRRVCAARPGPSPRIGTALAQGCPVLQPAFSPHLPCLHRCPLPAQGTSTVNKHIGGSPPALQCCLCYASS